MMRLAEYLLRWTGEVSYAEYWERNFYNGILAQQHPESGMVAYYLPLRSGSVKQWGTPTDDFWCCQGTLLQAQTMYTNQIFYEMDEDLILAQYIPSQVEMQRNGTRVQVILYEEPQLESSNRPGNWVYNLQVACEQPQEFAIGIRIPDWVSEDAHITINGEALAAACKPSTIARIPRVWDKDSLKITLPL